MKRAIIPFLTLLFVCQMASSQTFIGIRSGYNMSIVNFKPTKWERTFYRMGGDYGVTLKFYNMEYIGFQAELNYIERGYRLPVREWEFYLRNNRYIELPMYMQGRYQYKGTFLHLNLGCYGAYLLYATEGLNTTGEFVMEEIKLNVLYDNRFDFGISGGVGLGHEFSWGVLQVDGRIFFGFPDLFDHTYEGMPRESRTYNESVSVSYYLNLSKVREQLKKKSQLAIIE